MRTVAACVFVSWSGWKINPSLLTLDGAPRRAIVSSSKVEASSDTKWSLWYPDKIPDQRPVHEVRLAGWETGGRLSLPGTQWLGHTLIAYGLFWSTEALGVLEINVEIMQEEIIPQQVLCERLCHIKRQR